MGTLSTKYNKIILWPIHPRTLNNIKKHKINLNKKIKLIKPQDFFSFIKLELNSLCILTDSGTVQEEASIFKIPNVVLREKTERPETIEAGNTIISMNNSFDLVNAVNFVLKDKNNPEDIMEYKTPNVSSKILNIILSNYEFDKN